MKAEDQLMHLFATNRAFAGGDSANALIKKLQAQAFPAEAGGSRWRESTVRK